MKGETIYIYDEEEKLAIEAMRHEFLDYAISQLLIEPYKQVANSLILNKMAYEKKEKVG